MEERGTKIWLPLKEKLQNADLPLRLKIKQVVGYDKKYGLAGITDAALVALVKQNKTVCSPSIEPIEG